MTESVQPPVESLLAMARQVNLMVTGKMPPQAGGGGGNVMGAAKGDTDPGLPVMQGAGMATQAVAQSMAIAVQDSVDMLRNVTTIETTAIGMATAKWLEQPENPFYPVIITTSTATMTAVAEVMKTIGENTVTILQKYESISKGPKA